MTQHSPASPESAHGGVLGSVPDKDAEVRIPAGARIGEPHPRVDGYAKVTGQARYPADEPVSNAAYAFLLTSDIARGRIVRMHLQSALAMEGVLDILTHENAGHEARPPTPQSGGGSTTTLESDRVWHDGQIIGVIVAETYEIARDAAHRVRVDYEEEPPSATFDTPGSESVRREPGEHRDYEVGDADGAFAGAEVKLDAWYETPTQHHNPIELFTTTCAWDHDALTIWEPSQFVQGLRHNVAHQLGMSPERVRVISRYVGGAFGSKGSATARSAWIAVAARRVGRPVKLVPTRGQGYTIATYRAETRHHVRLGASRNGALTALCHEGWEVTSRPSDYNVSGTETTARVYACPNILTRVNVVHADRNTPGFMRAPPDTPYMFALECAMDELALALGMDPIELRRVNDTPRDPANGLPYSSRSLMQCFDEGAREFGWQARNPRPRSHRDGDWLVGWGCATAAYPSNIAATAARVTLAPDRARAQLAAHDIGTGAYTVVAQTVAQAFGLPLERVQVEMGDSSLPPASLAAGSSHTATIVHAVAKACDRALGQLRGAAVAAGGPLAGHDPHALRIENGCLIGLDGTRTSFADALAHAGMGAIEAYAENVPDGLPKAAMQTLYQGKPPILRGHSREDVTAYAFGAQFAEVRVHRLTGEIRAPRLLGAFAAGTIVNPLTAHSQYMGGMIWGLGCALLEKTEIDIRHARYVNDNISEYLVAANADVTDVRVLLVPEHDTAVNPMGIKGIGEIGIVGMNAAIANAVHHATGRRIRRLPIRLEDML
ncbi:xanthine dehydrogenase family protein molybdopterin-binding subunit [Bordetella genomosp. 9]|uniref:Xanthine dehydrogenase n=1 Tax=Bordetella genomosp. 9 TaxID=1416803 RepID=A0A1W6Z4M6_9BORD|nr:xanthine dehydrogenase family protein molybdopterin-binding subunit [Bordetella genomosp. 9]ARP88246.1 xanthine dehydrogenase [Bordetella genomosp. 9]